MFFKKNATIFFILFIYFSSYVVNNVGCLGVFRISLLRMTRTYLRINKRAIWEKSFNFNRLIRKDLILRAETNLSS